MSQKSPIALIVGVGEQTGAALARRFAREGYRVVLARRDQSKLKLLIDEIIQTGGHATGVSLDARNEAAVIAEVSRIEQEIGPIELAIFNAGAFRRFSILETDAATFRDMWETNALSGFHVGREVARHMVPRGVGSIIFTGATASLRGGSGFAAFAAAKFALRALTQSMARELGPKGIHVAHVIVDGLIEGSTTRARIGDYAAKLPPEGLLSPEAIAETYLQLHRQSRSAWTQELDLRPWSEGF